MKFVDLHTHTHYSDSTVSPAELVQQAREAGLHVIAVTDHDTLQGIPEAMEEGLRWGIEVIAGVELSTEENGKDIHILGYLMDLHHPELQERLALFRQVREERAYKIVEKLKGMGVHLDPERVKEIAGHGSIGRPHIAKALIEKGYVADVKEAFERYLGYDSPAYVPKYKMKPIEAIQLILRAGGIPVIAHPAYYQDPDYVIYLQKHGLMGVEVWHSDHSPEDIELYRSLAEKHGLLMTGGSDYHGAKKKHIRLGDMKLPYTLVRALKDAQAHVRSTPADL